MATSVIMPKAGMAMEEGIIVSWLKKQGDTVKTGEAIAEIETDKAVMEIEAEVDGVLLAVTRSAGEHVPVTEVIAWIGKAGETIAASPQAATTHSTASLFAVSAGIAQPPATEKAGPGTASSPATSVTENGGKLLATPAARRIAAENGISLAVIRSASDDGIRRKADVERHIRPEATPLASRLAEERNLDVAKMYQDKGSRVTKDDVLSARVSSVAPADRRVPLTKIQRISGERLSRSHTEIPAVTNFMSADISELLSVRESINSKREQKISLNDLAVRAAAKALSENPRVNAVLDGDSLIEKGQINIGLAVATKDGLLVPVLRNALGMGLEEASTRARDLAERSRSRRLKAEEMEGGTFTVTNIGMLGVTYFTPIINQPEIAILGVGAMEPRLVRSKDGTIRDASIIHLSLTFDHRALDGAEAAAFLKTVRGYLEAPLLLIM